MYSATQDKPSERAVFFVAFGAVDENSRQSGLTTNERQTQVCRFIGFIVKTVSCNRIIHFTLTNYSYIIDRQKII